MGSDAHYCLRWNNHQSNLLGVFSQLLQDESLVDVTLACSEGQSIRAHKVVLSACSSYFQSLFLDHPARHPIVILKDVRLAELQTLIEFMYKGEVNVQYCQLSALLKTAESLKVKGLAEMTNQSSALREPEREQDHLRPPTSSPQHLMPDATTTTTTTTTNSSSKRLRCSPSPPPARHQQQQQQQQQHHHHHHQQQPSPLLQIRRVSPNSERHHNRSSDSPPISLYPPRKIHRERERDYNSEAGPEDHSQPLQLKRQSHHDDKKHSDYPSSIDDRRSRTPDEDIDDMDDEDDVMSNEHETGINMTINSNSLNSVPPIRKSSSPTLPSNVNSSSSHLPSDTRPPSSSASSAISSALTQVRNGNGSSATGNGTQSGIGSATTTSTCTSTSSGLIATSSGITSPMSSDPTLSAEPIAGPSGLGPVQSVPLSLKKEIEWDRSDDKSIGESDYRHAHDSDASGAPNPHDTHSIVGSAGHQIYQCMYCGATFPHQSKLTRHILSHSLETLKYRETSHLLHLNFPHEAHFSQRPSLDLLDPPDAAMEIEFAAAAAAAAAMAAATGAAGGGGSNSTSGGSGASSNTDGNVVLCKFCGKSFPDVSSLITHLPVHTGDRPFRCEFCGKAFKLRHHMKDHCRVHTGERPFRCAMCGKTFSRSTILKAHEKTHFPKYVRKFLSPSPVDGKEEPPQ